jgi:DNA-binding transcriptional ArsR family regulator
VDAVYEPRLASAAAMIADPARSRMLAYLLTGEYASAGELARAASVTPATASAHLAKLEAARFVVRVARGRHRYFRIAEAEVAHALEALALVAERAAHDRAWRHPARERLRFARCCYGHLAGALGVRVFETLQARAALRSGAHGYELTPAGRTWLSALGLDAGVPGAQRRFAYACLDWSERRDHLGGQLADELYSHFTARGWLRRTQGRAVELTAAGRCELLPLLDAAGSTAGMERA